MATISGNSKRAAATSSAARTARPQRSVAGPKSVAKRPCATEFSTGRGGALRRAAATKLAASGLSPARSFPGISQQEPDGPATPPSYTGSADRLYNCGPTALATVLRGLGVPGLPASNTDLVLQLRDQLGTSTPNGTGAAAIPGVLATYGLASEQKVLAESDYTNRNFFRNRTPESRAAALERVLGPEETAQVVERIDAGQMSWEQARLVALRRETEQFLSQHLEGGHPVVMNVSMTVLNPSGVGAGHFITVTGVERGPDGQVAAYSIVDPWTGTARTVSADTMWEAIQGNSNCAPTAVIP